MKKSLLILIGSFILLSLSTSPVFAVGSSGFENASFSAASISQANAVTAQADEPAAISYNPAGLTQLRGIQVQSNQGFISAATRINQNGDISYGTGTMHYVPTAYLSINPGKVLNDRLALGIGSDSPFGLANSYDSNLASTRYTGYRNWLKMFTLKPTAAFKLSDWLSVGAGPMYYDIYSFGSVMAYPNRSIVAGSADGQLRANLSGQEWGWQMGALLKPHQQHQVGFYFRSPVKVRAAGQIKVEDALYSSTPNFQTGAYTNIDLPMNMTLGYAFKPTPKTTLESDFGYTRWSTYNRLHVIRTDSIAGANVFVEGADNAVLDAIGSGPDADKDYSDTFSLQLGAKHQWMERFRTMAGFFFYTAAAPKYHFTPGVPDGDRYGFTLGAGYDITKRITLDLAYLYEFSGRTTIDNEISQSIPGYTVDGKYMTHFNCLLLTLKLKWEEVFDDFVTRQSAVSEAAQIAGSSETAAAPAAASK